MDKELPKKSFEVKMVSLDGGLQKQIFIDNELLHWSIDTASYIEAVKMGPMYQREIQKSIEKHFIDSVSDFLGRKVSILEIKEAIKSGWI